jgi:hypothetical protein
MNTPGSFCSTRDILAVTPSDTARVGHVRMRDHCKNSNREHLTDKVIFGAMWMFNNSHAVIIVLLDNPHNYLDSSPIITNASGTGVVAFRG